MKGVTMAGGVEGVEARGLRCRPLSRSLKTNNGVWCDEALAPRQVDGALMPP